MLARTSTPCSMRGRQTCIIDPSALIKSNTCSASSKQRATSLVVLPLHPLLFTHTSGDLVQKCPSNLRYSSEYRLNAARHFWVQRVYFYSMEDRTARHFLHPSTEPLQLLVITHSSQQACRHHKLKTIV